MSKYFRVDGGVAIEQISFAGPPIEQRFHPAIAATIKLAPDVADVGWLWDGATFTAPPIAAPAAPPPVPAEISPRQLLLAMTSAAIITQTEALDAARTGAVPAAIEAVFSKLPAADAFAARVTWARMTVVLRGDPLVAALAASRSMTAAQVDDLFRTASAL